MMVLRIQALQQLILQQMQMELQAYLLLIWMVTVTWTLYLHLKMMIPLPGMKIPWIQSKDLIVLVFVTVMQ
jgi:hypothetical protein